MLLMVQKYRTLHNMLGALTLANINFRFHTVQEPRSPGTFPLLIWLIHHSNLLQVQALLLYCVILHCFLYHIHT